MTSVCHGPNENILIHGMTLHSDAIAKDSASGKGTGGVNGKDTDLQAIGPDFSN